MLRLSPLLLPIFVCLSLPLYITANLPRTLSLTNRCPVDYWFLPTAGAAPFSSPTLTSCSSDFHCIAGSFCLQPPSICFWSPPTPTPSTFHLPSDTTTTLSFPFVDNGFDIHWSGNLAFCERGTCGPFPAEETELWCDGEGCGVYGGPGNLVEFTWSKTGTDYYDVSNIAGVNVPLTFGPALSTPTTPSSSSSSSSPYSCGTPGATSGFYPSSWQFSPPSVYHQWVTAGGAACESNTDCASGELCGLTHLPSRIPLFQLQCGLHLGYWSMNSACALGVDIPDSPFDCTADVDALTRCGGGVGSCYQPGAGDDCCGCADWQEVLGDAAVPSSTALCVGKNGMWKERVLPELQWLKAGAPSAYVYPYDDMSSTFICTVKDGHINHIDYQLTLCP